MPTAAIATAAALVFEDRKELLLVPMTMQFLSLGAAVLVKTKTGRRR